MPASLPPGTFRLHPYAEPPLAAGRYTLTGDVEGLPGPVQQMASRVDVVSPRFTLPPDQILGTFPPAGARGSFTSRLPQIVIRRRTMPWERSTDLDAATAPTPWLALVLVAEGEGQLITDLDVADCVTPGVTLTGDADVPKSACLEIAEEVVAKTFPTAEDLHLLAHVRAVDMADTELAMGDDDGFLAVVMCNRLPQPNVRYLACLISVEGQIPKLPVIPQNQLEVEYGRDIVVLDLHAEAQLAYGDVVDYDTAAMKLPGSGVAASRPLGAAAAASGRKLLVSGATGPAASAATDWAAGPAVRPAKAAYSEMAAKARRELADGWSIDLGVVVRPMLRFPALAYWSFQCEERGDFQYLAEHVHVRLLGHVPEGPETPDGDPIDPNDPPVPGNVPEPPPSRPLPLVTETGHVQLEHFSRAGASVPAWYRGPLTPDPVPRAELRDDGRPPLAHHADQLRRVVPDGGEDLGYASAFEIGRLLALAQSGVVSALARWRQEAYGAARVQEAADQALADAPGGVRDLLARPDVFAADEVDGLRAGTLGPRAMRAVAETLGADGAARLGGARPLADPSAAIEDLEIVQADRDSLTGFGLGDVGAEDADGLLEKLASAPVAAADADPERTRASLRGVLEEQAMEVAAGAQPDLRRPGGGPVGAARADAEPPARDALDDLLDAAAEERS
jgi:hypothetical protein